MREMRLPKCVRIEATDHTSRGALLEDGWREIEILEVWVRDSTDKIAAESNGYICETAGHGARNQCVWIAGTAFTEDRLHKDPEVPDAIASREKMKFVDKAFEDAEKAVYVAHTDRNVHGFVIVTADDQQCVIDLIAVDRRHRRKGIARNLLAHLVNCYGLMIVAGTQSTNQHSIALYKSAGFEKWQTYRTLHK